MDTKEKINIMEMEQKENSINNKNDNNFVQRDRIRIEDYLMKIQKCIPDKDLDEFRKAFVKNSFNDIIIRFKF